MHQPNPIETTQLSVVLRNQPVLTDVSLTVKEGDFIGIIGPNGAGKSVLLKTILGLIPPTSGQVRVFGLPPAAARGLVGYVPQFANFDVQFPITVERVVLAACLARGRASKWQFRYSAHDRDVARQSLARVGMLDFAERQIGKLSGGQVQRVLIARALTIQPRLLLLDEPTASLDTPIGGTIYELLKELSPTMSIVLISHDIGVLSRHVKTIACLNIRLHYHHSKELTTEMVETAYGCPVDLIAHGHAHRVLENHGEGE